MTDERFYILNENHEPVAVDITTWVEWMEADTRRVARDHVGPFKISTVFLGIDHAFGDGDPQLFETMVFDTEPEYQERCATWSQALEQHEKAIQFARTAHGQ